MERSAIEFAVVRCDLGWLLVAGSARGVCFVALGDAPDELTEGLRREFPYARLEPDRGRIAPWVAALRELAAGRPAPLEVPLDVGGSRFQRRVWAAIRAIGAGETRSYGALARRLGRPGAARAVARACATNRVALAIPCHRVVAADGSAGGYRWGRARKGALLARERARRGGFRGEGPPEKESDLSLSFSELRFPPDEPARCAPGRSPAPPGP